MNQPPVLTDTLSADTLSRNGGTQANGTSVHSAVDSASQALHSTMDKASDSATNTVTRLASVAHQTVDKLASSAEQVAEKLADEARRVKEAPTQALQYSKSWVQERPLEAVGAALAIGFLLGRLTR